MMIRFVQKIVMMSLLLGTFITSYPIGDNRSEVANFIDHHQNIDFSKRESYWLGPLLVIMSSGVLGGLVFCYKKRKTIVETIGCWCGRQSNPVIEPVVSQEQKSDNLDSIHPRQEKSVGRVSSEHLE